MQVKSDFEHFAGFQSAQPLGMASGLIGNNQFVVPDEDLQAQNARRLWNGGWSVLNTYVNSYSGYFTSIGSVHTFPKSILQSSPVFFQIDFIRMKMVRYLLVGVKIDNTNGDRTFALSYRNVDGKSVVYGDTTTPIFVQVTTETLFTLQFKIWVELSLGSSALGSTWVQPLLPWLGLG